MQAPPRNLGSMPHWQAWGRGNWEALDACAAAGARAAAGAAGAGGAAGANPSTVASMVSRKLVIPGAFAAADERFDPLSPHEAANARRSAAKGASGGQPTSRQSGGGSIGGGGGGGLLESFGLSWDAPAHPQPAATPPNPKLAAALGFKPMEKGASYHRGASQGSCNSMATSEVSAGFVLPGSARPPRDVRRLPFDALVISEGEWSSTCNLLGVTKLVDRFATAIGLVANIEREASHASTLRSFVATGVAPELEELHKEVCLLIALHPCFPCLHRLHWAHVQHAHLLT